MVGSNQRLCKKWRCDKPINPPAKSTLGIDGREIAAWESGYCSSACEVSDALTRYYAGKCWWQKEAK